MKKPITPRHGETLRDAIDRIRRVFTPDPDRALYLYTKPSDYNKYGATIVVYAIFDSSLGVARLHRMTVDKQQIPEFHNKGVDEWAIWIQTNVPGILRNTVTTYLNRTKPGVWRIRGIIGWHFIKTPEVRRRYRDAEGKIL